MSRTDLDPSTLAKALRRMAGDGSVEWVMEPIQASVLLDVADALDENAKLRKLVEDTLPFMENNCAMCAYFGECTILVDCKCIALKRLRDRMRELGGRRRVEEKE